MIVVSATQLATAEHCERKWGWAYIEGFRESNSFATLGSDVHAQLEAWLRDGVPPDDSEAGQIAESGLHHWPAPRDPVLRVEFSIGSSDRPFMKNAGWVRETPDGWQYAFVGRIDVGLAGVHVSVGDHKTTTDFKWAKTAEDLHNDIQAAVYALAQMDVHGVDEVQLQWVYYRTRGARKSMKVSTVMTRVQADQILATRADPVARKILEWKLAPGLRALDLAPNVHACKDFGGCVHRDRCDLTAMDRLKGMMAMDLKTKLQQKIAANAANKGGGAPAIAPTAPVAQSQKINPPEGQKAPAQGQKAPAQAPKAAPVKATTAAMALAKAKEAEAEALRLAQEAEAEAEALRLAQEAEAEARALAEAEAELAAQAITTAPTKASRRTILYIGCLPSSDTVTPAGYIVERAHSRICQAAEVADYRLVEYGKGAGMLVAQVREELKDVADQDWYIDPSSEVQRLCIDVFAEGREVVRRVG